MESFEIARFDEDTSKVQKLYLFKDEFPAEYNEQFCYYEIKVPTLEDATQFHTMMFVSDLLPLIGHVGSFVYKQFINSLEPFSDFLRLNIRTSSSNIGGRKGRYCLTGRAIMKACQEYISIDNIEYVYKLITKVIPTLVYSFNPLTEEEGMKYAKCYENISSIVTTKQDQTKQDENENEMVDTKNKPTPEEIQTVEQELQTFLSSLQQQTE